MLQSLRDDNINWKKIHRPNVDIIMLSSAYSLINQLTTTLTTLDLLNWYRTSTLFLSGCPVHGMFTSFYLLGLFVVFELGEGDHMGQIRLDLFKQTWRHSPVTSEAPNFKVPRHLNELL